jgi:uncharacterized hydrophobic protein (TIGR00271 family)
MTLLKKLQQYFELTPEEDEEQTYKEVLEATTVKGYNFWILGFAMIIACIGLNTDSISAVIGAMLISPLMGPIQGFAFGLAINDVTLKKTSIRNWLLMTIVSLTASVGFFLITPFEWNTEQLSAFKHATIFDIILALIGGMAGYIGLVKKEGTKVIAGVATATACMPPLCTAGYGIAHADMAYALGGMYFYLINCLFIGLATFALARFTGFHNRIHLTTNRKKNNQILWSSFIVLMTIPGIYLAYNKWQNHKTIERTISADERIRLLETKVNMLDSILLSQQK